MSVLSTKQLYVTPPMPASPPAMPIQFVKPVSYEFRVAEVYDENNNLQTVKLQMQVWEHDEYGSGNVKVFWHDVPRIKLDQFGSAII